MDALGIAAAIGQLLGQINSLYQQIDTARQAVKAAPGVFANTRAQLDNLSDILQQARQEKDLDTPAIKTQLKLLTTIMSEIGRTLHTMNVLQGRSRLMQGLHALSHGQRDEIKLANMLTRLERAKAEMLLQINVAHVGLTGRLAEEVKKIVQGTEALASRDVNSLETTHDLTRTGNGITHTNEGARTAAGRENNRSEISNHTRPRSNKPMNYRGQPEGEAETATRPSNKPEIVHEFLVEENKATDNASQVNGIMGIERSKVSTTASILENRAAGMSQQRNLILDSSSGLQVIRVLLA